MRSRKLVALVITSASMIACVACGSDSDSGTAPEKTTTSVAGASTTSADGSTTSEDGSTTSTGTPSLEELSAGIKKGMTDSDAQATCAAEAVAKSDLPDASLRAIADADPGSLPEDEFTEARKVLVAAVQGCG